MREILIRISHRKENPPEQFDIILSNITKPSTRLEFVVVKKKKNDYEYYLQLYMVLVLTSPYENRAVQCRAAETPAAAAPPY